MANPPITNFAVEPDVPNDPLAAAEGPEWARARHMAVLGLPLDERTLSLLAALEHIDLLVPTRAEAATIRAALHSAPLLIDGRGNPYQVGSSVVERVVVLVVRLEIDPHCGPCRAWPPPLRWPPP